MPSSFDPEFNDEHAFAVQMDADLDKYLRTRLLDVYVFDQNDSPDVTARQFLGVASIPLVDLSQDKSIVESFELNRVSNR